MSDPVALAFIGALTTLLLAVLRAMPREQRLLIRNTEAPESPQ